MKVYLAVTAFAVNRVRFYIFGVSRTPTSTPEGTIMLNEEELLDIIEAINKGQTGL